MAKKIRVWDGTQWQDVAPALPYTAVHSAQASMPSTGVDGQIWLDTDGTLSDTQFVPLAGGTMTGNLNVPSINSGPIVGRNKILNGDFGIWQRGTSFSSTGYTADRFAFLTDGSGATRTVSRQALTPASISGYESNYFLRINQTVAGTGQTFSNLAQPIEDITTLAGKTVTLSFWAKADSNRNIGYYSAYSFGTGGSASIQASPGAYGSTDAVFSVTTSWQRFTATWTMPSISGKTLGAGNSVEISIAVPRNTTFTLDIWGVQLEAGNQATPFHTATPNQQTELAACQRYYYRINAEHTYGILCSVGYANTTSQWYGRAQHPVPMRIAPSSMEYGGTFRLTDGPGGYTTSVVSLAGVNNKYYTEIAASTSGMTQYRTVYLQGSNDANSYIAFSAEL